MFHRAPAWLRRLSRSRLGLEWLAVGLIACLLAGVLARAPMGDPFDRAFYDQLVLLNPRHPSDRILIVAIDDASLGEVAGWPWSRATHAALLDKLTEGGVAAVAYDALFLEPDPKGGDAAFAAALKRSGRTVLPVLQLAPGEAGRPVRTVSPIRILATSAAALGHVNIAPDADDVVRRVSARVALDGACWSQLALTARRVAEGAADQACAPLAEASRHSLGMIGEPQALVPFAGAPGRFRTVSAGAVIRGEAPPEFLRGRIVLVGATAAGLGDRYPTASSGAKGGLAGVELQANLLDAAIAKARMRTASPWLAGGLAVVLVFALLAGLVRLRPRLGLWMLAGLIGLTLLVTVVAFFSGWWLQPLPALAGLALAYPLWSWRRLALTSDALGREIARFDAPEIAATGIDPLSQQLNSLEQATGRLRDLYRMVAETLQSLPDPTVAADQDGLVRLANGLAASRTGLDPVGLPLQGWLYAALGQAAAAEIAASLAQGVHTLEVTAADGAEFEVGSAEIRGVGQGASWTIVRLADITAIRRAVRQREDALQLLTHDIRAPYASISALIGSAQPSDLLKRIDLYAARGRALAESYVQWSRAENAETAHALFDLRDAVMDAADELWSVAEAKGVRVATEVTEDEVLVDGDRALITRAIINLIGNAIRFSPPGAVVEARCAIQGRRALCTVADRGPGVDPAARGKLFQRFARRSDDIATTGAGLGLAIAALAARRMGGEATYADRPGGGAQFRLDLPLA